MLSKSKTTAPCLSKEKSGGTYKYCFLSVYLSKGFLVQSNSSKNRPSRHYFRLVALLICGCGLVLLLSVFSSRENSEAKSGSSTFQNKNKSVEQNFPFRRARGLSIRQKQTAEEQVQSHLAAFDKNRRDVARRYAEKLGVAVPADLEKFFDAADAGDWEEIDRLYKELDKERKNLKGDEAIGFEKLFQIAKEVWGAHEAAHSWPAQALLDYGRDVLGSLKPGMVYIGGTDAGRFIPTLLNETSRGEHHIVLTQNAFADATYLEYANFLYGDRMKTLSPTDSQRAFQKYLQDIAQRSAHDQQFPDEPKQVRPGENYKSEEGRVQVSGQTAVMSINELLLKTLQEKNPDLSFAMEESFSLPSTYKDAIPLGPILQLGSENENTQLTPALADSSLDYWREHLSQMTSAPDYISSQETERAYAHMIMAQGNLFSSKDMGREAEEAYRLAQQLAPTDVEPLGKLYNLLVQTGRANEAAGILAQFQQVHSDKTDAIQKLIGSVK
jgi:hypothetical protein